MKTFYLVALFMFLAFGQLAQATELVLSKPSIVIVYSSPEKARSAKEGEENAEADADFSFYTLKIQKAMASIKGITIIKSKANQFRFANSDEKPVSHNDLHGLGFIFYKPQTKPVIFKGVATDEDVVCEASKFFEIKVKGYECGL